MMHDAIIIGGGHNGLVCAAYLAQAGLDVLLLERREVLGGACVTEELFPGYRFSACSYYCHLLQTKVIDDLELRRHGFEVSHINPQKCYVFPDGRALFLWDSVEQTQESLAPFSSHDARAYPRWVAFWKRAAGLIHPYFLTPPPTIGEVYAGLRTREDRELLDTLLTTSMRDLVREYFEDEAVRGAFIHAHDVGDSAAAGSAWCLAYIKCNELTPHANIGIVTGGMGGITQAMAASARSRGATLRTGVGVSGVLVENGTAGGVRLANGDEIRSRVVISNADPKRTLLGLIEEEHLPAEFLSRVRRLRTATAYLKFTPRSTGSLISPGTSPPALRSGTWPTRGSVHRSATSNAPGTTPGTAAHRRRLCWTSRSPPATMPRWRPAASTSCPSGACTRPCTSPRAAGTANGARSANA